MADLRRLGPADLLLLDTLLQLFLHDLSAHVAPGELPLGPDGRFDWGIPVEAWVTERGRAAYVLEAPGPVGLVLTSAAVRLPDLGEGRSVDAFWIAAGHRRRGVGRAAWRALAATWAGRWEVAALASNPAGLGFCRAGVAAMADGKVVECRVMEDGEPMVVFSFRSGNGVGEQEGEGTGRRGARG